MSRAFNTTHRLTGERADRRMPLAALSSFDAIDKLMEQQDQDGAPLARVTVEPQAAAGIVRADGAPPVAVPPGYRGRFVIPDTGRLVWWTGRVAIGLRYEPAANVELGFCAEQVQTALLANRKAA